MQSTQFQISQLNSTLLNRRNTIEETANALKTQDADLQRSRAYLGLARREMDHLTLKLWKRRSELIENLSGIFFIDQVHQELI